MDHFVAFFSQPWPWWISGPLIGLFVPALLLAGNKEFGVSSTFRHICAAALPGRSEYLNYNWRKEGGWQLAFATGMTLGGMMAVRIGGSQSPGLTLEAQRMFAGWGLTFDQTGLQPAFLTYWDHALTLKGFLFLCVGGFLVGFGTRWANGCTSGHAIMGLSLLNPGSLVATAGFFAGGTLASWFLVPLILSL